MRIKCEACAGLLLCICDPQIREICRVRQNSYFGGNTKLREIYERFLVTFSPTDFTHADCGGMPTKYILRSGDEVWELLGTLPDEPDSHAANQARSNAD